MPANSLAQMSARPVAGPGPNVNWAESVPRGGVVGPGTIANVPVPTVRRFKRSDGHAWLIPHHPAYAALLADDATILGTVVAVARSVTSTPSAP